MIRSGLKVPTPAMPMPAFAVPNAAPAPARYAVSVCRPSRISKSHVHTSKYHLESWISIACSTGIKLGDQRQMQPHPAQFISILKQRVNTHSRHTMPMNGANLGVSSFSAITVSAG